MALKWNPFKLAKIYIFSESHTKMSINLDFPFIAIYPVATNHLLGCMSKDTISSSCSLKNDYLF